jgi:hypothetical protein
MAVFEEARFRGVAFAEDEVAGNAEAGALPGGEEKIGLGPAIEADADTVRFQDPKASAKAGFSQAALSSLATVRLWASR